MAKSFRSSLQNRDIHWWMGSGFIALLILIGATAPFMTYVSMAVSFAMACFLGYLSIKKPGTWMGKTIIVLLCLQNLCIGVGAHIAGNTDNSLRLLTQIPFMTISVIWIIVTVFEIRSEGIKKYLSEKTNIFFILLLVCISLSLLSGHGNIQSCLVSLRNITVFFMTCQIGKKMVGNKEDLKEYIGFFLTIAIIMFVLGLILMAGGYDMYKAIGVHEVYIAKAAPFAQGKLNERFLRLMGGNWVQRMASIYFEPVNIAYFFAAATLCALFLNSFKKKSSKVISIVICTLGLALTLGKGGYLLVIMPVCCLLGEWFVRKLFKIDHEKCKDSTLIFFMILIAFAGVAVVTVLLVLFWDGRELIMPHIRGIEGAMGSITMRPWGYGIGTGGNAALAFNGNTLDHNRWYSIGGETSLMSFMYQIGIHGIIVFMMCVVSTGLRQVAQMQAFEKVIFCIPWALICVSVFQDNTFAPQCVVPFMLLVGATGRAYITGDTT